MLQAETVVQAGLLEIEQGTINTIQTWENTFIIIIYYIYIYIYR